MKNGLVTFSGSMFRRRKLYRSSAGDLHFAMRVTLSSGRALGLAMLLSLAVIGAASNGSAQTVPASADPTSQRMMQMLAVLSADSMEGRRAGSPGAVRARRWIVGELNAMGVEPAGARYELPVSLRSRVAGTDTVGANLVARIPGSTGGDPVLVLSAHYDHLGVRNGETYNGADDDASGCVALLIIAERLKKEPPLHDVILAFFDAEESGMVGSRAFVASPPVPIERIALDINLDMVARQDGGALWVSGTAHYPALRPLAEAVSRTSSVHIRFGHDTRDLKPGDDWTNSSDHAAFHARGIPFLYLGVEDHPDYHKPGDDAGNVDPVFYRGAIEFAYALVRRTDRSLGEIKALRSRR